MENSLDIENTTENLINEEKDVALKRGRKEGWVNTKYYVWKVTVFNRTTNTFSTGKYTSVANINEVLGTSFNSDHVRRIRTKYRADLSQRNKNNSFLARYGHYNIEKIKELITE